MLLVLGTWACHRPAPLPQPDWDHTDPTQPVFPLTEPIEVPAHDSTALGIAPEDVIVAIEHHRPGRLRFLEETDDVGAELRSSFEQAEPAVVGRTGPPPRAHPNSDWNALFGEPKSNCAHDAVTLEVTGTWSFELRSHGRWVAADSLWTRVLVQGTDLSQVYVFDAGGVPVALPPWPAERLGVPELTEQRVSFSGTLRDLVVDGNAGSRRHWTFRSEAP